jgi:hypothetical protein
MRAYHSQLPLVAESWRFASPDRAQQPPVSKIPLERHQTGINFSLYWEKTINCRIPQRLALHRINGLADYRGCKTIPMSSGRPIGSSNVWRRIGK